MSIEKLFKVIEKRASSRDKKSYTKTLLMLGSKKIAQKFGEESAELIVDYLKGTKKRTLEEAADVIYHFLVLLKSKKITLKELNKELSKRDKDVR